MIVCSLLLACLLAPQGAAPEARPAASFRHGVATVDAESLARKLEAIERRAQEGRPTSRETVVVTEKELNSYLNLTAPPKLPPGLADVEFRLERERLEARGLVDLDRLQARGGPRGSWNPLALLSGWVEVELRGRLPNADGLATVEVEEVRLGGVSLPLTVLAQLVSAATRSQDKPQGFDIRSAFPLPYALKRVRLEPGRALLEF